jgi:hypothetical protein
MAHNEQGTWNNTNGIWKSISRGEVTFLTVLATVKSDFIILTPLPEL